MPTPLQVILHLTDLHFGYNAKSSTEADLRTLSQRTLLNTLKFLEPEWKPTIICLSGDIGYSGSASDYTLAKTWLDELLAVCELGYDRVIVAAGNHDIIQSEAERFARPSDSQAAEKALELPVWDGFFKPFQFFIEFCSKAVVPPMQIGAQQSWLVGERMLDGIRFVTLNSSWYCRDKSDKGKLWLGLPHLRNLAAKKQLENIFEASTPLTVTLIHHPFDWLREEEYNTYANRPNPRDFLAKRTHLILTGHTHARTAKAHTISEAAYHLAGGAAYAGGEYDNGFRLIQLNPEQFVYRSYEYDAGSDSDTWNRVAEAPLLRQASPTSKPEETQTDKKKALTADNLRNASKDHASQLLVFKSRLMKPNGQLPELLPQTVAVQVTLQGTFTDNNGKIITPPTTTVEMPLYEAVREARFSVLLGELGSGKSTLAANLVLTTMEQAPLTLAVIVPAKELVLDATLSPVAVLTAIDHYILTHISIHTETQPLAILLQANVEILLVLDGLDEIEKALAGKILRFLATLTKLNASLQVVATARPIELTGVSFDDWKVIRTLPLQDPQRLAILRNEALANGATVGDATQQATELLEKLSALPALDAVADTPLFIRLLYPKLLEFSQNQTGTLSTLTLSDLLFDVVAERLERWAQRDEKSAGASVFQSLFPSAEDKGTFLGELAKQDLQTGAMYKAGAQGVLLNYLPADVAERPDKFQLVADAIQSLQDCGLATVGTKVEFSSQPLTEMLAAIALANTWAKTEGELMIPAVGEWRVVSFAAGLARRWQLQEKVRPMLKAYHRRLLADSPAYLAAVAFITIELQDVTCAQEALDSLEVVQPGQLVYKYQDNNRSVEAQAIAQLLLLAGQRGLQWFYDNYLDPKQPVSQMGIALVEEVLRHWINLWLRSSGSVDVTPLSALIEPHKAYGRGIDLDMLPYLVLLFPSSFSPDERIKLLCGHIGNHQFFNNLAATKLREATGADERKLTLAFLLEKISEAGGTNLQAAILWLELSNVSAAKLPIAIVEAALEFAGADANPALTVAVEEMLGEAVWVQQSRWALTSAKPEVAAGAAIALHKAGQQDFWLLCAALFYGIDDLRRNSSAELLLGQLIEAEGEKGRQWLANQTANRILDRHNWKYGLSAGLWRLFLSVVESLPDGPVLLGEALLNLGVFTLSRFPEIREKFNRLLTGTRSEEFLAVLQEQLTHPNPKMRWGAAGVLITFDPQNQADALIVSVETQEGIDDNGVDNWTQFCLSLSFGTEPLHRLQAALPELTVNARIYALTILYNRKVLLTSELQKELFRGLLQIGNWQLNRYGNDQTILANPAAKLTLLDLLEAKNVRDAEQSASELLAHHSTALTQEQEAVCYVRSTSVTKLKYDELKVLKRLRTDALFSSAIENACQQLESQGARLSLFRLVYNAVANSSEWEAVVREFVHGPDRFYSIDDVDMTLLLEIGNKFPEYRQPIGEAALKLSLETDKWQDNRRAKAVQWLVLLADEFLGGLPAATLENALQLSSPTSWANSYHTVAARALLARLPEIPASLYNKSKASRTVSVIEPIEGNQSSIYQQLIDLSRDASSISEMVLDVVYQALFHPPITEAELQQLSLGGTPGVIIAMSLRFCYSQEAKLAESVILFEEFIQSRPQDNDKFVKNRLQACWLLARNEFLHQPDGEEAQAVYVTALDHAFAQGTIWPTHLALELLNVRGTLLPEQVRIVLNSFADGRTAGHSMLFARLCRWLASDKIEDIRAHVVPALREGLNKLNQLPWQQNRKEVGADACFLFSFAYWAFAEEDFPATQNVFLRGIKQLYAHVGKDETANFAELLEASEPLLLLVPPHYITEALEQGRHSHDSAVRQFSRLITYFAAPSR